MCSPNPGSTHSKPSSLEFRNRSWGGPTSFLLFFVPKQRMNSLNCGKTWQSEIRHSNKARVMLRRLSEFLCRMILRDQISPLLGHVRFTYNMRFRPSVPLYDKMSQTCKTIVPRILNIYHNETSKVLRKGGLLKIQTRLNNDA